MPPRHRGFQKPKNLKASLLRLTKYIKPYTGGLIVVALCIIAVSLLSVAGTYMLKVLVDDVIAPLMNQYKATGTFDMQQLINVVIVMLGIYLLSAVLNVFYHFIVIHISTGTLKNVRDDLFKHLQTLPISYFDTHSHGEIMSSFTNDTDAIREMLSQGLPNMLSNVMSLVGVFVMMCILSLPLTVIVVISLFVILKLIGYLGSRSRKNYVLQQKGIATVNGYIEEMIEGQKVVKVFNHEEKVKHDFDIINENLRKAATDAQTYSIILFPIMGNLGHIQYAITAIIGAVFAITFKDLALIGITAGTLISFLQYTKNFSQPITQISQHVTGIVSAMAGAERIFNIMDVPSEEDEGFVTLVNASKDEEGNLIEVNETTGTWAWKVPNEDGKVTYTELKGSVVFENVDFSYVPEKQVLNNISLWAKPGQKIAFVGSTGAGKTTITNLINRFYDIQEGTIKYDGINIKDIKKSDLRKSLTMVLQDTHLFTGTVMENVRYGRLDATDEEVIEACKLANADHFIRHLQDGSNTMLTGDGQNLSQGQRQLLSIARAAVANPPVLILDEATSSIDTRTEKHIEKGMDGLMNGRTTFVIAHRLSTVRNSNAIMVLEKGQIIERGDHDKLIEDKGKYYQLYTGMFELD